MLNLWGARSLQRRINALEGLWECSRSMMLAAIVALGLAAVGCGGSAPAATAPSAPGVALPEGVIDVSRMLDPIRTQQELPALAAAVWRGSDLVAIGASGVRKFGTPSAASTQDQWHLGSDTKAMTATLAGIYADRGQLRLDDTVAALFAGETIDPGYASVTLEQLLQHRAGAPADFPDDLASRLRDGDAATARREAVRALLSRPPAQAPGEFHNSALSIPAARHLPG